MKKLDPKVRDVLSIFMLVIFIVLCILGIKFLGYLADEMDPYPKETHFEDYLTDVSKIVFVNGEDGEEILYGAYFDKESDIEAISEILVNTEDAKEISTRYLKGHKIINNKKWMRIYHTDGTCDVITFYGTGAHIFELPNGELGYITYFGTTLTKYISKNQKYGAKLDSNYNLLEYGKGFTAEDFFGSDYEKAWWGY